MKQLWIISTMSFITGLTVGQEAPCDHNFMARLGLGVLTSPNFPFDYPITTRSCTYRIYSKNIYHYQHHDQQHRNDSHTSGTQVKSQIKQPRHHPKAMVESSGQDRREKVCFRFRRFKLAESRGECHLDNETYLEFPGGARFTGSGWLRTFKANVFQDSFCWPFTSGVLEIRLVSPGNCDRTALGFYADFVVYPSSLIHTLEGEPAAALTTCRLSLSGVCPKPCSDDDLTCFDDQSCVPRHAVCDGTPQCADGSDEDYSHARCPDAESYAGCDFEVGMCHFQPRPPGSWVRTQQQFTGLRHDHTKGREGLGHFLFTASISDLKVRILKSVRPLPTPKISTKRCFRFWCFMATSTGSGRLSVVMDYHALPRQRHWGLLTDRGNWRERLAGTSGTVWSREGFQGNMWMQAEIDIPEYIDRIYQIVFRHNTLKGGFDGIGKEGIAIDDISMLDGACFGDDISSTFELGLGGWRLDYIRPWTRRMMPPLSPVGEEPDTDCSQDPDVGHYYMYSDFMSRDMAFVRMVSKPISNVNPSSPWCLTFCYFMAGPDSAIWSVKLKHVDDTETHLFWDDEKTGKKWVTRRMLITDVDKPVQVVFEAMRTSTGRNINVGIDNIQMIPLIGSTKACTNSMTPGPTYPGSVTCNPIDPNCNSHYPESSRMSAAAVGAITATVLLVLIGGFISILWKIKRRDYPRRPSPSHNLIGGDAAHHGEGTPNCIMPVGDMMHGELPPPYTEQDITDHSSHSGMPLQYAWGPLELGLSPPRSDPPPAYDDSSMVMLPRRQQPCCRSAAFPSEYTPHRGAPVRVDHPTGFDGTDHSAFPISVLGVHPVYVDSVDLALRGVRTALSALPSDHCIQQYHPCNSPPPIYSTANTGIALTGGVLGADSQLDRQLV